MGRSKLRSFGTVEKNDEALLFCMRRGRISECSDYLSDTKKSGNKGTEGRWGVHMED